jgi:large subunit ribosomal protein L31
MAQVDIHPKQHKIVAQLNDGSKIDIVTSYGKDGEVLKLDIDPTNHPAWQADGKSFINVNDDRVSKFNKKFGGFDFGVKSEADSDQ